MRFWNTALLILGLFVVSPHLISPEERLSAAAEDECARMSHSEIYSNAVFIQEAGDVVGFELALQRSNDNSSVSALLYNYQGEPNELGIPLSGQIVGRRLSMEGKWVLHLIAEPSKKEIAGTRIVKLDGKLDSAGFQGTIKIGGLDKPISVWLKRVDHIWLCKR